MKASLIGLIMGILALAAIAPASLDAQTSVPPAQSAPIYTAAQLDQLLAPVALYPDQLLGQILMASTYPLEVLWGSVRMCVSARLGLPILAYGADTFRGNARQTGRRL
jgi:hypothetical protein